MIMQRLPSDDSEDTPSNDPSGETQIGWMYRGVPQNRLNIMARVDRLDAGHSSSDHSPPVAGPVWLSLRRIVRQTELNQLYFG
jgi:hypothetical protein